jgi:hypothetical protein
VLSGVLLTTGLDSCCFEHHCAVGWTAEDHLCIFELNFHNSGVIVTPALVNSKCLPGECLQTMLSYQLWLRLYGA